MPAVGLYARWEAIDSTTSATARIRASMRMSACLKFQKRRGIDDRLLLFALYPLRVR